MGTANGGARASRQPRPSRAAPVLLLAAFGSLLPPGNRSGAAQDAAFAAPDRSRAAGGDFGYALDVVAVQLFPVVKQGKRRVTDLTAADFVVRDQGQPVAIDSFAREAPPLHVVLLLDVSDSMGEGLARLGEAACRFVDRLLPVDRVSVYVFNHRVHRGAVGTHDRKAVKRTLRSLVAGGGTALFDALVLVAEDLPATEERTVLLLFSDGRDQTSRWSHRDAIDRARRRGIVVYTLSLVEPVFDFMTRRALAVLADETGGESILLGAREQPDQGFDRILADLHAQYRSSYTPPPGPPGERRVEVRSRNPAYRVRCRKSYFFPG